jgi:hypothetical protein
LHVVFNLTMEWPPRVCATCRLQVYARRPKFEVAGAATLTSLKCCPLARHQAMSWHFLIMGHSFYKWHVYPVQGCLGLLHTRDWEPVTIALQAFSLVEKPEPVQVPFTLCLRDQRSMWMKDGCQVYMDSYMASNGSCFMVTWTIFKNHLLEVGLTQYRKTVTLGEVSVLKK